jgi:hypothetical protein
MSSGHFGLVGDISTLVLPGSEGNSCRYDIEVIVSHISRHGIFCSGFQQINHVITYDTRMIVCFTHYQLPESYLEWHKGTKLRLRSVLPVVIWNDVQCYACTIHTSIEVILNPMEDHDSDESDQPFVYAPSLLKSRCYVFSAWWMTTMFAFHSSTFSNTNDAMSNIMNKLYLLINEQFINKESISLDKLMQLPQSTTRSTDQPDLAALELTLVRSNQDIDYLSQFLPQVSCLHIPGCYRTSPMHAYCLRLSAQLIC